MNSKIIGSIAIAIAAIAAGIVAIVIITIAIFFVMNTSYEDSHCSGLGGEELLLCLGYIEALDSGGSCEGLSSLECVERNIDLDDDGIHNEIDQCPEDPETINSPSLPTSCD